MSREGGIRTRDPLLPNQSDVCGGVHPCALKPNKQGVERVSVSTAVQGDAEQFGSQFGSPTCTMLRVLSTGYF